MPSIKDFDKKNRHKASDKAKDNSTNQSVDQSTQAAHSPSGAPQEEGGEDLGTRPKRRPGREKPSAAEPSVEASQDQVQVVDVEEGVVPQRTSTEVRADVRSEAIEAAQEVMQEQVPDTAESGPTHESAKAAPKVEVSFYGSELFRARFPRPFQVLEAVATDWVHDGNFEGLPVGNPLLQYFVGKGLKQAKSLEKRVLESPALEKAATKAFEVGLKAQQGVSEVKGQVEFMKSIAEAQIKEVKKKLGREE